MKISLLALLLTQVLAGEEGSVPLLRRQRELHAAYTHDDTTFPNGTALLEGGHLLRDPEDTANSPGSLIWTGEGNKPASGGTAADSAESPLEGMDVTCFSGEATVELPSRALAMKDLSIGDRILVEKGRFERVYAFAHRNPARQAEFVTLHTTSNQVLELTPPHLVFLEGHDNPIRADAVKVGDILLGGAQRVTKIGTVQREGIYAPLTKGGKLLVNGVVASNYVALQEGTSNVVLGGISTPLSHHDYIHIGMSPFRLYCGLSDKFCKTYNADGMPPYVAFSIGLSRWVYEQNMFLQLVYMAAFFVFTGLCFLLETPVGLAAATALYMAWRKNNNHNNNNATVKKSDVSLR